MGMRDVVTKTATPVAKSLHTISVIVQVARHLISIRSMPAANAIEGAMQVLMLDGRPDPYQLKAKALSQLTKKA
jgi:hypothetical protein